MSGAPVIGAPVIGVPGVRQSYGGVGLVAEGAGVTEGEGDAVGVPVGDGVPVAGVVRGTVGVIRGIGLRVVGRGDVAVLRAGEVECCVVVPRVLPVLPAD